MSAGKLITLEKILDAFAGSGTTCAVAEKLGRRWIGIDCGKLAIYTMQKRMLNLRKEIGNKGPRLEAKPFTLYNAGLYDFSKLKELPWDSWRFFALQLFQCRDEPHTIGGIRLGGYLKGANVLVFDHMKEKGVRIDEATIVSLHEAIGTRVGSRLYIRVQERAVPVPFQDALAPFNGIVFAVIRRRVNQLNRQGMTVCEFDQPLDELSAMAGKLRAVI